MGFASGFQVGAQAVERGLKMREEDELKRGLAQAYAQPTSDIGYTPEQMAEMRRMQTSDAYNIESLPGNEGQTPTLRYTPKQGLDLQGDYAAAAPTDFAPQQVQRYGGQTVAGQFDPAKLQGLQMREAARIIGASGDPVRASQLNAEALRMEREAQEAPLRLQGLKQTVEAGGLDVEAKRADQTSRQRLMQFDDWSMQNPNAGFQDISTQMKTLGLSTTQQAQVVRDRLSMSTGEYDLNQNKLKSMTQGKNMAELLKIHQDSELLDPGSHFTAVPIKGGKYSLQRVDTATGKAIGAPVFTGTEAEATKYLHTAAVSPEAVADYTINLRAKNATIDASEASTRLHNAQAGALGSKGLTQKFTDMESVLGRKLTEGEKLTMMGAAPKPREVTSESVASLAKEMVGKPTGRLVDGKPEKYTMQTAAQAARTALSSQGETTWPAWGGTKAPAAPAAAPAAAPTAAPAGLQTRSAADALAAQRQREDDEMMMGKRTVYSPAVQGLVAEQQAAREAEARQQADYLARERQRMTQRPY